MKREAVEHYHDLLNSSDTASKTQEALFHLLRERKLYFGGRPLCTVLRPHFYTSNQFAYLKQETEVILGAFDKAHRACINDPARRSQFWLEPWEEEMMSIDRDSVIPW